mmetsp:Transcript_3634/g.11791  ORF Transcript_3634/g.11791 Transcript_3634/m.11791 type:complete len:230 (-) Transcript_3634:153-842(-)
MALAKTRMRGTSPLSTVAVPIDRTSSAMRKASLSSGSTRTSNSRRPSGVTWRDDASTSVNLPCGLSSVSTFSIDRAPVSVADSTNVCRASSAVAGASVTSSSSKGSGLCEPDGRFFLSAVGCAFVRMDASSGSSAQILRNSLKWPSSTMRSASSSAMAARPARSATYRAASPCGPSARRSSRNSARRPGVAMTTSGLRSRRSVCFCTAMPPTIVAMRTIGSQHCTRPRR